MRLFGHKLTVSAQVGLVIIAVNVRAATLAPLIPPYPQADIVGSAWGTPSAEHWFGLDNLGRDVFSRLLYGAQVTIGISILITLMAFILGVSAGFAGAILGRSVDIVFSFIANLILSMPTLIFALVVLSVMGTDIPVLIITV